MSLKDRIRSIEEARAAEAEAQETPPVRTGSAGWRTVITLWALPAGRDLLGAEQEAARTDEHAGTLVDVLRFAAACVADYHGAEPPNAGSTALVSKVGSVRSRLSNGGGRMTQRVFYDWEGKQRLATIEIERIKP